MKEKQTQKKSLKLKIKLFILKNKKTIKVSQIPVTKISNDKSKKIKTIQPINHEKSSSQKTKISCPRVY
mgnify:CR=1 FL=1